MEKNEFYNIQRDLYVKCSFKKAPKHHIPYSYIIGIHKD
jgi:hypothetical protein